jgi:glycosyltransferase involved in cell wall biosynthesis
LGGYLVQYELADYLASAGETPTIIHAWEIERPGWRSLHRCAGAMGAMVLSKLRPQSIAPWHRFHPQVRLSLVPWLAPSFLPQADVTILTAYQTAASFARTPSSGPLVQLVYDYEFWAGGDAIARGEIESALHRADIHHIAGSTAVRQMLDEIGVPVVATVPPGVDTKRFYCRTPPLERQRRIGFAFRTERHKGVGDLISALEKVHDLYPDVAVRCFGRVGKTELPHWVDSQGYLTEDELPAFYDQCAIFVLPSHYEGWGLPAAEAMACGAAVVTTNCGGTTDFAEHERNALVVEPGDVDALGAAIVRLLDDADLRYRIATAGSAWSTKMTSESAAAAMEAVLRQVVDGRTLPT